MPLVNFLIEVFFLVLSLMSLILERKLDSILAIPVVVHFQLLLLSMQFTLQLILPFSTILTISSYIQWDTYT